MKQKLNFEIKDIFPNPVDGYFTFTFISNSGITKGKLKVSVFNTHGLPVIHKEYDNLISHSQYTIKTEQLITGIYDVIFNINTVSIMQKIKVLKVKTKRKLPTAVNSYE